MNIAYFDCFAGVAGDMITGALIDAGADFDALKQTIASLGVDGFELTTEKTVKGPLAGTNFTVDIPKQEHHHRGLADIVKIIKNSGLSERAKDISIDCFDRIAKAEAGVHGKKVEEIHFHEVGAIDSIVDITAAATCLDLLNIERVISSPIPLGSGTVKTAHGLIPLPAPATVRVLNGIETVPGINQGELTTPTGAAFMASNAEYFGTAPAMKISSDGYGAGDRKGSTIPNMLRVIIGTDNADNETDSVVELSANIDDCDGETLGHTINTLIEHGCLDAWICPVYTKKNRPAWLLSAICIPERVHDAEALIFRETTTFGIRKREMSRRKLTRKMQTVETEWGNVIVKTGRIAGKLITTSPEYEDCRLVSESHDVSLREVMFAAKKAAEQDETR